MVEDYIKKQSLTAGMDKKKDKKLLPRSIGEDFNVDTTAEVRFMIIINPTTNVVSTEHCPKSLHADVSNTNVSW